MYNNFKCTYFLFKLTSNSNFMLNKITKHTCDNKKKLQLNKWYNKVLSLTNII